jgi:hypothetical protein
MEMRMGVLADAANETKDGKLNILGVFFNIVALGLPVVQPSMTMVAQFHYTSGDAENPEGTPLTIELIDADGNEMGKQAGRIVLKPPEDGLPGTLNLVMALTNQVFERAGLYEFKIRFGQDTAATIPFHVLMAPGA